MPARESIEKYIQLFANLRTDKSASRWPDRVRNRTSHKPILLLSVLDLFELNKIDSNFIEITEDLLDLFDKYWLEVLPVTQDRVPWPCRLFAWRVKASGI